MKAACYRTGCFSIDERVISFEKTKELYPNLVS